MLLQTLFRRSTSLLSLSGFVTGQATMSTQVPSSLWKLGRLNHVAIATPDLLKSVSLYRDVMGAAVRYILHRGRKWLPDTALFGRLDGQPSKGHPCRILILFQ